MTFQRSGGILLHPTSLAGPYGIGDLGPQAFRFIDWLAESGSRLWQVLPLGHTGYGDSPYQCFSAFAGNPYLVSPDLLVRDGLLKESDLAGHPGSGSNLHEGTVDFASVIPWKMSMLQRAFKRFEEADPVELREEFGVFRAANAEWLDDYALFMALKEQHGGGSWVDWPEPIRKRDAAALEIARQQLSGRVLEISFHQLLFFRQWGNLRSYAHEKGIQIIGDIPIFVAEDSSDVWAHPELFHLDEQRHATVVAGVPPDYFSPTGQRWGNPLYRWDEHQRTGYAWWIQRFQAILRSVDIVRLDHFRGFAGYWEIPAANATAEIGRWLPGPGSDFLDAVQRALGGTGADAELPIIAEDLGVITPDVVALRERYRLPGMKILQFGFSGADNPFLPHNYRTNCVAYTGTHDNDTARGWFDSAQKDESRFALRYLHASARRFTWELIRGVWASVAIFAIVPMQDLLDLGTAARMNYPSRLGGNWHWRMLERDLTASLARKLKEFNQLYLR